MALIKKIDVEKHFAARRAMRLGRIWPVSSPDRAVTSPASVSGLRKIDAAEKPELRDEAIQACAVPEVG
jgi:hypothetical protein